MAADFRVRGVGCARRRSECGLKPPRVEKPATLRIQSSYMPAGKRHIGYTRAGILFDAYPQIMLGQGGNKPCSQLRTSPAIHYLFHKIYQLAGGFIVRRDTSDVVEQLGTVQKSLCRPAARRPLTFATLDGSCLCLASLQEGNMRHLGRLYPCGQSIGFLSARCHHEKAS